MAVWLLALLGWAQPQVPDVDCDVVELNSVCDASGCESFRQLIWWDLDRWTGRYVVVDWLVVKDESDRPQWTGGRWVCTVRPRRRRWLVRVSAPVYRRTWTVHDPEVENRSVLAERDRRLLR